MEPKYIAPKVILTLVNKQSLRYKGKKRGLLIKKVAIVLFLLVVAISGLSAWQETYNAESPEYQNLMSLARMAGRQFPEFTLPASGSQLLQFLDLIDRSSLNPAAQEIYDELHSELAAPTVLLDLGTVAVDLYAGIGVQALMQPEDTASQVLEEDWLYQYRDRIPNNVLGAGFWWGKNFAARFYMDSLSSKSDAGFSSPFAFTSVFSKQSPDLVRPHTAYASLGNDTLNLIVGRDRLSAGSGMTGNLSLGDNFLFENFIKFSAIANPVTYDLTLIAFDSNIVGQSMQLDWMNFNAPSQIVVIHRLSASFWNKIALSIYEGTLNYGVGILSDPRILNPFMILHNTQAFMYDTQNNFFGVELSAALPWNLQVHAQVILDQIQTAGEAESNSSLPPNAWGALLGFTGSWTLADGILDAYAEGLYTSPGLYLKEAITNPDALAIPCNNYDIDLVVGNRTCWDDMDIAYLGHSLGPDTIAVGMGSKWRNDWLNITLSGLYSIRGTYGKKSRENQFDELTRSTEAINIQTPYCAEGFSPEYKLAFFLKAEGTLFDGLTIKTSLAYTHAENFRNTTGRTWNNVQFTLGASVELFGLIFNKTRISED